MQPSSIWRCGAVNVSMYSTHYAHSTFVWFMSVTGSDNMNLQVTLLIYLRSNIIQNVERTYKSLNSLMYLIQFAFGKAPFAVSFACVCVWHHSIDKLIFDRIPMLNPFSSIAFIIILISFSLFNSNNWCLNLCFTVHLLLRQRVCSVFTQNLIAEAQSNARKCLHLHFY